MGLNFSAVKQVASNPEDDTKKLEVNDIKQKNDVMPYYNFNQADAKF